MSRSRVASTVAIFLLVTIAACAGDRQSGPAVDPEAFAREWLAVWNSHDVEELLTFYTEDVFYEDVPSVDNGWAEPMRGHQMLREELIELFAEMPDVQFEHVSASGAGDRMVVEWIMTGSHWREFSGEFSIRAVSVIEMRGEKIAWGRDYYDAHLLMTQLGLVPVFGSEEPEVGDDS
jgi:steroid delta-isomerase-like uncharacterized protein